MKIFRDTVCLWANSESLEPALGFVRDFRSCSRTVLLGPNFFLANGPNGVRCFYEMGVADVILDLRLIGSPREIWQCVTGAGSMHVKGVSISALAGRANLENAINAAEASKVQTGKVNRLRIIISPLPPHIDDAELIDDLGMRIRRKEHIKKAAQLAVDVGADGIILDHEDMPAVRKINRELAQLVFAQKKPYNPYEIEIASVQQLPSIAEIVHAKAAHVILDSQLIQNTDAEHCADLLYKEIENAVPVRAKKQR